MVIVAINNNGKVVKEAKLSTSPARLETFFSSFNEPVRAVVECMSFWQEAERLVPGQWRSSDISPF